MTAREDAARDRAQRLQQARRAHAASVAERLGADWTAVDSVHGTLAARPRKTSRLHGEIAWQQDGRIRIDLHNATPELVEHIVAGIRDHMRLHESGTLMHKRPRRLSYLLELMVTAGYRIDELHREHEALFGTPLFNMDMRTSPGMPLLPFLFERQWALDRAIRVLELQREEHDR